MTNGRSNIKLFKGLAAGGFGGIVLAAILTYITQIPSFENLPTDQKQCVDAFVEQIGIRPDEIDPHDRKISLKLIEKVRAHIFRTIKITYHGSEFEQSNDPCAVLERHWGLCFNTSRLFELAMQRFGL